MPSVPIAASELQRHLALGLACVNELWRFEAKNWITSVHAADINLDGDIEVLAGSRDGRAYVLSKDGQQIGDTIVGDKAWVSSILGLPGVLDQQSACIIAGSRNGKIYLLDKEGKETSIRPAGQDPSSSSTHLADYLCDVQQSILQLQSHPAAPETLIFSSENGKAYGFDMANRKMLWTFRTNGLVQAIAVCDLKDNNCLVTFVGSADHSLTALSSSGAPIAQRKMDQAIISLLAADIDGDGEIEVLVGTRTKKLYALAPDLSEKWSLSLSSRPLALAVADVNSDQHSEIIIACDDQSLTILDCSGMLIWRQKQNKRFYSLYAADLDRDGHTEILAGSDDNNVYALRIQLSKDLDKEILRNYAALNKPDPSTLLMLTTEQRELLLDIVGPDNNTLDHNLSLERAEALLAAGNGVDALFLLLKLDQQKFQLLWEKEAIGYKGLPVAKPAPADFIERKEYSPDPTFTFDCFLDDIETILGEQKLILLLDEFEELDIQVREDTLNPGIFEYLRSLMQKRQYVHFLLSGTHHIEQMTRDYWSIFFNIALHYRLPGRITASGAEDLITGPMSDSFKYDTLAVTKIRQLTADQPYLINLVCNSLVAHCNEMQKNYATLHDVNIVLNNVIDTGTVHFSWLWKQIEPDQQLLLQVIAEGTKESWRKVSLEDISAIYREYGYTYNRDEVVASLKALQEEDVVETNKDDKLDNISSTPLYHIPIGLLRHWLRYEQPLEKQEQKEIDRRK
jgi:outer membrane protein assembly factor BamB